MKTRTKIVLTAVATVVAGTASKVLQPGANLVANATVVGQMEHSDSASLLNTIVGNGAWVGQYVILALYAAFLVVVWSLKSEGSSK